MLLVNSRLICSIAGGGILCSDGVFEVIGQERPRRLLTTENDMSMKTMSIAALFCLFAGATLAQISCNTDSLGTTRCSNGQTFTTDSLGVTRDNRGNTWSTDALGTTRDYRGNSWSTDSLGTTRDNRGNSWSTDSLGTTRGSNGTICTTDSLGTMRCR
jgi:hypothetical protein